MSGYWDLEVKQQGYLGYSGGKKGLKGLCF